MASDRDVVSRIAARPSNPSQARGHHTREECPHARIGDRGSQDRRRQDEDSDEEEAGAPAPVRGQRLRCGAHEGDEDEARAPQAPRINRLPPHGEHLGEQRERQPGGCDADDLAGSGCRHPRACTEVPLGGTARNDHRGDAEHSRGDKITGNRADGGEKRPPMGAGRVGLEGRELIAPHPVGRRYDRQRDGEDGGGRASRQPADGEVGQ